MNQKKSKGITVKKLKVFVSERAFLQLLIGILWLTLGLEGFVQYQIAGVNVGDLLAKSIALDPEFFSILFASAALLCGVVLLAGFFAQIPKNIMSWITTTTLIIWLIFIILVDIVYPSPSINANGIIWLEQFTFHMIVLLSLVRLRKL